MEDALRVAYLLQISIPSRTAQFQRATRISFTVPAPNNLIEEFAISSTVESSLRHKTIFL